ncbi:uncharacterized protein LOC114064787 [Empidonax traillii]|uniref:uncharacterized protein LOC114064787 n=1 Tax=Empidonax traillii TaxID=164674 RepID=UPI000FFD49D6|nr:uncharacterized protein LOC114064787 [Empidonax traillii]
MNGMANVNSSGRSHYPSAIPVPRAMTHGKLHTAAPPSTPGSPVPHRALSPWPGTVPAPKTLKPKGTGRAASREPAKGRERSPSVPPRGRQKALARPLVSPGRNPEAVGSRRRGAGRVGEPTELPKAPSAQGRAGGWLEGSPGKGSIAGVAGTGDESHGGSQGRGPVFGSGAITFSSGPPHSHPVTATVAPFHYRLQEDREQEGAASPGDEYPGPAEGPDRDPKPRGLSESRGASREWRGRSCRCQGAEARAGAGARTAGLWGGGRNPHTGGAPTPLGRAGLQFPHPVTPVAKTLHSGGHRGTEPCGDGARTSPRLAPFPPLPSFPASSRNDPFLRSRRGGGFRGTAVSSHPRQGHLLSQGLIRVPRCNAGDTPVPLGSCFGGRFLGGGSWRDAGAAVARAAAEEDGGMLQGCAGKGKKESRELRWMI